MNFNRRLLAASLSCVFASSIASAGDLFAYAPTGRTDAQQQQDKYECHQWAVEQSQFDPVQFAAQGSAPPAATPTNSTSSARTANSSVAPAIVGGGARGALISEAAKGEADRGAAIGAGAGLMRGRMAQRKAAEEQAAAQSQAQAQRAQQQSASTAQLQVKHQDYQRARATCFRARGYTVSES